MDLLKSWKALSGYIYWMHTLNRDIQEQLLSLRKNDAGPSKKYYRSNTIRVILKSQFDNLNSNDTGYAESYHTQNTHFAATI